MAITEIKRPHINMPVAILAAGISNKMKSYEPRALLKIGPETLVERQIRTIRTMIDGDILLVVGYKANKIIRKVSSIRNLRIIENQNYSNSNAAESTRLAVNNNSEDRLLAIHGDICFNLETIKDLNYNKSFLVVDNNEMIKEREVGVTITDGLATNMSYDLQTKWCQIVNFAGREYQILKSLCRKDTFDMQNKLLFEIINTVIGRGGSFICYEPPKMKILEIDSMNDLYENTNSK
jgi:choline kinase